MDLASRPIVVGVSTTPDGQQALRWATDEAIRRELPLRVVLAQDGPAEPARLAYDNAMAYVHDRVGAGRVSGSFVSTRPALALVEESAGAELVVLGSRSRSTVAAVMLGSVSCAVAAHAAGPVVVVRNSRHVPAVDRIVAGFDGSPESDAALAFAFEEAALRGSPLDVVYVWQQVPALDPAAWTMDRAETEREDRRRELRERVTPYQDKHPKVAAATHVLEGRPATLLTRQSDTARMVVVGSRGHGGIAGLLLGSVSQALLHHAQSTVAVIRRTRDHDLLPAGLDVERQTG